MWCLGSAAARGSLTRAGAAQRHVPGHPPLPGAPRADHHGAFLHHGYARVRRGAGRGCCPARRRRQGACALLLLAQLPAPALPPRGLRFWRDRVCPPTWFPCRRGVDEVHCGHTCRGARGPGGQRSRHPNAGSARAVLCECRMRTCPTTSWRAPPSGRSPAARPARTSTTMPFIRWLTNSIQSSCSAAEPCGTEKAWQLLSCTCTRNV